MADDAVVFALANPDPEIDPSLAQQHAAVVATGRSDYPNQINNVLAFPGIFRGLLDAQARGITDDMLLAASAAIADVVAEPNPLFIVPSVFDATVRLGGGRRGAQGRRAGPRAGRRVRRRRRRPGPGRGDGEGGGGGR